MFVGIIVFLVGWVYAISEFGFFLGVGLGWFPALVIAWLSMQVVSWVFVLLLGGVAAKGIEGGAPRPNPMAMRPRWLSKKLVATVVILISMVGCGFFLLESELNGRCDNMRGMQVNLKHMQDQFRELGVDDLEAVTSLPRGEVSLRFGESVANKRHWLSAAEADYEMALYYTRFCFR